MRLLSLLHRPRLALLVLALLAAPIATQEKRARAEAELEPLAAALAAYREARATSAGVDAARAEVARSLVERAAASGGEPLADPARLGRAWWLALRRGAKAERGGVVATAEIAHGSFAGAGTSYAFRLPRDYDPERAYPLLLAIPGENELPADHLRQSWSLRELQEQVILVSPAMPARTEDWGCVMVQGRAGGLSHVLTALRIAGERFAVDPERVYVAGYGKAVPAAVAAGNLGPQRFAGVIGRAGDAGPLSPDNFRNLPTFFAGAAGEARAFGEAARAAGHDNSRFEAGASEADLWAWMGALARRAHPERVVLVTGDPFPTRAHWLQVNPSEPGGRATATLERGANVLRIETRGVAQVTVYLNDALLDLARPVRVILDGEEREQVVPRSLATFLELLHEGISDPGCVYVARIDLDLVAAPAAEAPAGPDSELEQRRAAAGEDVAKLWELHEWCAGTQRAEASTRALRTLVRLDPDHERARAALGHVRLGTRWFTSSWALERFALSQDPVAAARLGRVEYQSLWMHRDERALAVKGWVKDHETGLWLTPSDAKRIAQGWVRQDLEWIPPEDATQVDAGLWLVDGEWLDLARADRRHATLDSMWRIPGPEILVHSTAERAVALRAMQAMERALIDLRRVFGTEPVLPIAVAVLREEEQYDRFAFGDPDGRRPPAHAGRLHAVHSAYFAESWFPRSESKREFGGLGVCVWDTRVRDGDAYGVHAARLAAGLAFVEALDPSPLAVRKALSAGPGPDHYAAYQAEKQLPAWLRWGAAVYGERYFEDDTVAPDGDRWWARTWSLDNLRMRGGLRELGAVFAFELDPDDREDSLKLLIEAGLVVAFAVDGDCAPVVAAHAAFTKALAAGRPPARLAAALAEAIAAHEAELRAFAGL